MLNKGDVGVIAALSVGGALIVWAAWARARAWCDARSRTRAEGEEEGEAAAA